MTNAVPGRRRVSSTSSLAASTVSVHEGAGVLQKLDFEDADLYFMTTALKPPETNSCTPKDSSGASKVRSRGSKISSNDRSDTAFTLQYLNKGAANAVFKIIPASHNPSAVTFTPVAEVSRNKTGVTARPVSLKDSVAGKVLRVPRGKARTLSGDIIVSEFHKIIKPMFQPGPLATPVVKSPGSPALASLDPIRPVKADFSKHLMDHQGVLLFPSVVSSLRSLVKNDVFHRQPDGSKMCWGILLEDMSPVPGSSIVLEFKPKWLLQSPDAPPHAKRCRTCATQILAPKKRDTYICPLRLVNGKAKDIRSWLHTSLTHLANQAPKSSPIPDLPTRLLNPLLTYLTEGDGHALLMHIKHLQAALDPHGILAQPPSNPPLKHNTTPTTTTAANVNLRAAMTLRDCSLFIRIEYDSATGVPLTITSKLGDLDFKSEEKMGEWADKECKLRAEGLYVRDVGDDFGCWLGV